MLYVGEERDYDNFEKFMEADTKNQELLKKIDNEAKQKGEILHRILTFPAGDGKAIYQVVDICDDVAVLKVCLNVGDEWIEPVLGEIGEMPLDRVTYLLQSRDKVNKMFGR